MLLSDSEYDEDWEPPATIIRVEGHSDSAEPRVYRCLFSDAGILVLTRAQIKELGFGDKLHILDKYDALVAFKNSTISRRRRSTRLSTTSTSPKHIPPKKSSSKAPTKKKVRIGTEKSGDQSETQLYEVLEILKFEPSTNLYTVRWNYVLSDGSYEVTEEPSEHLANCTELLEAFRRRQSQSTEHRRLAVEKREKVAMATQSQMRSKCSIKEESPLVVSKVKVPQASVLRSVASLTAVSSLTASAPFHSDSTARIIDPNDDSDDDSSVSSVSSESSSSESDSDLCVRLRIKRRTDFSGTVSVPRLGLSSPTRSNSSAELANAMIASNSTSIFANSHSAVIGKSKTNAKRKRAEMHSSDGRHAHGSGTAAMCLLPTAKRRKSSTRTHVRHTTTDSSVLKVKKESTDIKEDNVEIESDAAIESECDERCAIRTGTHNPEGCQQDTGRRSLRVTFSSANAQPNLGVASHSRSQSRSHSPMNGTAIDPRFGFGFGHAPFQSGLGPVFVPGNGGAAAIPQPAFGRRPLSPPPFGHSLLHGLLPMSAPMHIPQIPHPMHQYSAIAAETRLRQMQRRAAIGLATASGCSIGRMPAFVRRPPNWQSLAEMQRNAARGAAQMALVRQWQNQACYAPKDMGTNPPPPPLENF